jgi:very-short-patch-repair endonuclease
VLKGRKLGYQFLRQRPISDYIGDFFCKDLMLFIETDGITHQWEEVKQKDKEKEEEILSEGYTILRFKDLDVAADIDRIREINKHWIKEYEIKHPKVLSHKSRGKRKFPDYLKQSSS